MATENKEDHRHCKYCQTIEREEKVLEAMRRHANQLDNEERDADE